MDAAAAAAAAAARDAGEVAVTLPLLIVSPLLLPGQRLRVALAEPRLLRLAHELYSAPPPRRIALADAMPPVTAAGGEAAAILTEADVLGVSALRGGAVALTLIGRRRVALLSPMAAPPDDPQGVPLACVGAARDALYAGDAASRAELAALTTETRRLVAAWVSRLREGGFERAPGALNAVLTDLGPAPPGDTPADAEALSLWAAALVNAQPLLASASDVRAAALRGRDTRARLLLVCEALAASSQHMGATTRAAAVVAATAQQVGAWAEGAARAGSLLARLWQARAAAVLPPQQAPAAPAEQQQPAGVAAAGADGGVGEGADEGAHVAAVAGAADAPAAAAQQPVRLGMMPRAEVAAPAAAAAAAPDEVAV
jgi:hypothetical protein